MVEAFCEGAPREADSWREVEREFLSLALRVLAELLISKQGAKFDLWMFLRLPYVPAELALSRLTFS